MASGSKARSHSIKPAVKISYICQIRSAIPSMTAGFDAYLVKPVKEQDVRTILSLVFDERLR